MVVHEVPVLPAPAVPGEPFEPDAAGLARLGITPRELEILQLIAAGLSNREITTRLFVSENTVKTHSSRLFTKLAAKRRTQAVQLAKGGRHPPLTPVEAAPGVARKGDSDRGRGTNHTFG